MDSMIPSAVFAIITGGVASGLYNIAIIEKKNDLTAPAIFGFVSAVCWIIYLSQYAKLVFVGNNIPSEAEIGLWLTLAGVSAIILVILLIREHDAPASANTPPDILAIAVKSLTLNVLIFTLLSVMLLFIQRIMPL